MRKLAVFMSCLKLVKSVLCTLAESGRSWLGIGLLFTCEKATMMENDGLHLFPVLRKLRKQAFRQNGHLVFGDTLSCFWNPLKSWELQNLIWVKFMNSEKKTTKLFLSWLWSCLLRCKRHADRWCECRFKYGNTHNKRKIVLYNFMFIFNVYLI